MHQLTNQKTTQRDRLLALLLRRAPDRVPLPAILELGIAQYNARILELRHLGYQIVSEQEGDHSWFRLIVAETPRSLFAEIPERHRDDG